MTQEMLYGPLTGAQAEDATRIDTAVVVRYGCGTSSA